jgi:hypothetical protein
MKSSTPKYWPAKLVIACGWLFCAPLTPVWAQERAFQFGLIGDMPYTAVQQREYEQVLEALNKTELAFVVHVGDFRMIRADTIRIQRSVRFRARMNATRRSTTHFKASGIPSFSRPETMTGPTAI